MPDKIPTKEREISLKRPTRDDVARHANVSGWTVSNVLNGRASAAIREETRERVLAAARELGYRPNTNARALVTGRSCVIGLWMCLNYSQYRSHVLHIIQQQIKATGYELVIRDIEEELHLDPDFTRTFQTPVDGILSFDTPTAGTAFSRVNAGPEGALTIPFVSMGAYWSPGFDVVGIDLYAGARVALEHLLQTGRRRIAHLIPYTGEDWPHDPRVRAYEEVLRAAGLTPLYLSAANHSLSASRAAVREFLSTGGKVDAIFCHNDDMAFGAHRALCDAGVRIGPEVALVGCDGIEETEYLSPPLTTIVQPIEEMCRLAWETLQVRIQNPNAPLQQHILTPQLAVRASSEEVIGHRS